MMKRLQLHVLCKKASVTYLNRGISTNNVLLTRARRVKVPPRVSYEPGIRRRQEFFQKHSDGTEDVEDEEDIDNEIDMMNIDKAYDAHEREKYLSKRKLGQIITAKKYFSPRPQPVMLMHNERLCIKHLHKEDPVQWNIKILSESFPATPDTIKKIIKSKAKFTPERVKMMDSKAQRNWELLAEGKLDADPHVLEHMKKFVNRREVLLEQIKNVNFYLPEVKKEPVWNNGEFSNILGRYQKAVEKLTEETEKGKLLQDGMSEIKNETEEKSSLDIVHKKVKETVVRNRLEGKDSFLFGGLKKFYSEPKTLEEVEDQLLKEADEYKKLGILDKAILESKLGVRNKKSSEKLTETLENTKQRYPPMGDQPIRNSNEMKQRLQFNNRFVQETPMGNKPTRKSYEMQTKKNEMLNETESSLPDDRTMFTSETGVAKLLRGIKEKTETKNTEEKPKIDFSKPEIDFSDPERIKKENMYYDSVVKDIEETSFWNTLINSNQKELVESAKRPIYAPVDKQPRKTEIEKTSILSQDDYPERIKIPPEKQGTGLTFKVKDCFYDDDGEFLYRVPGMIK